MCDACDRRERQDEASNRFLADLAKTEEFPWNQIAASALAADRDVSMPRFFYGVATDERIPEELRESARQVLRAYEDD